MFPFSYIWDTFMLVELFHSSLFLTSKTHSPDSLSLSPRNIKRSRKASFFASGPLQMNLFKYHHNHAIILSILKFFISEE